MVFQQHQKLLYFIIKFNFIIWNKNVLSIEQHNKKNKHENNNNNNN